MKLKEKFVEWFACFIEQYLLIVISCLTTIILSVLLIFSIKTMIIASGATNRCFNIGIILIVLYFFFMSILMLSSEIWFLREVEKRWPMDKDDNGDNKND